MIFKQLIQSRAYESLIEYRRLNKAGGAHGKKHASSKEKVCAGKEQKFSLACLECIVKWAETGKGK